MRHQVWAVSTATTAAVWAERTYDSCSTEELRKMVYPPWPDATRAQLLAYFHNRYPHGTFRELVDPGGEPIWNHRYGEQP